MIEGLLCCTILAKTSLMTRIRIGCTRSVFGPDSVLLMLTTYSNIQTSILDRKTFFAHSQHQNYLHLLILNMELKSQKVAASQIQFKGYSRYGIEVWGDILLLFSDHFEVLQPQTGSFSSCGLGLKRIPCLYFSNVSTKMRAPIFMFCVHLTGYCSARRKSSCFICPKEALHFLESWHSQSCDAAMQKIKWFAHHLSLRTGVTIQ
jgi:hypothetical protein